MRPSLQLYYALEGGLAPISPLPPLPASHLTLESALHPRQPLHSARRSSSPLLPISTSIPQLDYPKTKSLNYCWKRVLPALSTSLLFGYSISALNPIGRFISISLRWCDHPMEFACRRSILFQAAVNAIVFLGAVFGALSCGSLLRKGRARTLKIALAFFLVGGIVGADSSGVISLAVSRILSGVGMGISTVATPLFISEITVPERRGFFGMCHQVMIGFGIFVSIALGLPQSSSLTGTELPMFEAYWWRFIIGLPTIIAAIGLIAFYCGDSSETPHWLIENGRGDEALLTLKKIFSASSLAEIADQAVEIGSAVEEAKRLEDLSLWEASFAPFYRYGLFLGFFLAALQQCSGINVIVSSSGDLFAESGMTSNWTPIASTALGASNAFSTLAAAPLVERLGRKTLLLFGLITQAAGMALPSFLDLLMSFGIFKGLQAQQVAWVSVAGSLLFVTAFAFALGPVTWIYLSEIFPVEIRAKAMAACGCLNWFCAFTVVFISKFLTTVFAFNLFAGICCVGAIISYIFVIETKGCSLEDSPVSPRMLRSRSSMPNIQRKSSVSSSTVEDMKNTIRRDSITSVCGTNTGLEALQTTLEGEEGVESITGDSNSEFCLSVDE